jgi:hypothetical protein
MYFCEHCEVWLQEQCLSNKIIAEMDGDNISQLEIEFSGEGEALEAQIILKDTNEVLIKQIICLNCGTVFPKNLLPLKVSSHSPKGQNNGEMFFLYLMLLLTIGPNEKRSMKIHEEANEM